MTQATLQHVKFDRSLLEPLEVGDWVRHTFVDDEGVKKVWYGRFKELQYAGSCRQCAVREKNALSMLPPLHGFR